MKALASDGRRELIPQKEGPTIRVRRGGQWDQIEVKVEIVMGVGRWVAGRCFRGCVLLGWVRQRLGLKGLNDDKIASSSRRVEEKGCRNKSSGTRESKRRKKNDNKNLFAIQFPSVPQSRLLQSEKMDGWPGARWLGTSSI